MAELPKTYDPNVVEPKWYQRWLESGVFRADPKSPKPPFSIVIPPPNITGVLTMGHVLNNTIQDILARRARMLGHETLWLPGTDHAGVATQTAVEKHLWKTEKKTKADLGREEFLRRVRDWQDKHGGIIIEQLKRLGCSCDWSRLRYTFDDAYVRAVTGAFVDLYSKGLIYRGRRMINWDPKAQTALSDEEVISTKQKGSLYFARYELVEDPGRFLEVATTRPETIMADVALAVSPKDARYQQLLGKQVWRPLAREKLPIIADEVIDPEFGTGVLKVTPAHDKVDFDIGQRHNLPVIDVLHPDGRINCPAVPELDGLDRFEARKKAAELLRERGLLGKEEAYENNVGFSERAGVPIEPRLSEQWFLHYPKTEQALAVVRDHLIRFFPRHWEKVYAQWLENIQDWCISRQIWWGHRVPVWSRTFPTEREAHDDVFAWEKCGTPYAKRFHRTEGNTVYVATADPEAAPLLERNGYRQDPDTLDTWFSSWLWAYQTMDTETRAAFYPTSVLVTGPDIIFFWVARMIIAGLEFQPGKSQRLQDNIPFRDVFFTGIIRDAHGRKMSKSLGNSPDPLDLIAKYGADGLRFGLMRIAPTGQDIRFDEKQIEEGRNFATKLWNAARFRQMHGGAIAGRIEANAEQPDCFKQSSSLPLSIYSIEVLARLNETIAAVEEGYRSYEFNSIAQRLYEFFWSDYCDWFVEAAKTEIFGSDESAKQRVLAVMDHVLSATLRLLHPLMPHVTEELWSIFDFGGDSIESAPLPSAIELPTNLSAARSAARAVYDSVQLGRNLRATARIPSNKKAEFILRPSGANGADELPTIARLLNAEQITIDRGYKPAPGVPVAITPLGDLHLLVSGGDRAAEAERLDKEIVKTENELRVTAQKLANRAFVEKAPRAVVEEHERRKADFAAKLAQLRQARAALD